MSNDKSNAEGNRKADELRVIMEQLQARLHVAKIAYHNRTELDGKIPEYEDLAGIAKDLIRTNYQLQRELYGEVKLKLSISKLLRASSR